MNRSGSVIRIEKAGEAVVSLEPLSHCGQCSRSGGCGVSFSGPLNEKPHLICSNALHAKLHDKVELHISDPSFPWVLVVAIAYGVPTVGLLLGAVIGNWSASLLQSSWHPDALAGIGALLGLCGGLFAWNKTKQRLYCHLAADLSQLQGEIVQVSRS